MKQEQKYHWIKEEVEIDFKVSKVMKNMMEECEKLDLEEDYAYFNYCETLGYMCKEAYVQGKMTKKQWEIIEERYENYE